MHDIISCYGSFHNKLWHPLGGEKHFMSLKQPAVGLEHCAMSNEQDECPESYKQSHSL